MAEKEGPSRVVVGVVAIFLGWLGVHKFMLGQTTPGVILACASVLTCCFGTFVTSPIGIIEGIIILTKSDEEFHQTYVVNKKAWF